MLCATQQIFSRLLLTTRLVIFLFFTLSTFICQPAAALLQQYQDAPGIMQYKSQHRLQDEAGYTWQVVLFKQIKSEQSAEIDLRLVGFPSVAEFVHPHSLEIITDNGKLLIAEDEFAQASPSANVGQYNLTDIIDRLPQNESLTLSLPLVGEKNISLKIPQPLVIEWQWLAKEI